MRIALNLLYLLPGMVGGTETYAKYLIESLSVLDATNEYLVFLNRESGNLPIRTGPNFRRIVAPLRASNRGVRYAWEQTIFPLQLRAARVDVVHSLGYVGPLCTHCPHVVTIHDVNYRNPVVGMSALKRHVMGGFVDWLAVRADHILTMSEFSKSQIIELLGIPSDKITTARLASKPRVAASSESIQGAYHRRPYIIAFGDAHAHKNIPRLIAAFAAVADVIPHQLVIIGRLPATGFVSEAVSLSSIQSRITLAGYLSDDDLRSTVAGAAVLAFPSLYEGFGLPILDAQAEGVVVACSTAGSLPEVSGGAAILFDPLSVPEIAGALVRAATDQSLRADLIRAGHRNVKRFSWEYTARATLDVYNRYGNHVLQDTAR